MCQFIKVLQTEVLNKERFAAMGRVVAGVAHEIRNPLFGISSIGQIFERELVDPAHRELAHALLSETKRLNQLVEELLVYGRPMKLMPGWCDLLELWQEVIGMHRDEIGKKGIKISCGLDISFTFTIFSVLSGRYRKTWASPSAASGANPPAI